MVEPVSDEERDPVPVALGTTDHSASGFLSRELVVVILEVDVILLPELEEGAERRLPRFFVSSFFVSLAVLKVTTYFALVEGCLVFEDFGHVFHLGEVVGIQFGCFEH